MREPWVRTSIDCREFFLARNRLTSIHASHPIEIGSAWSKRESCFSLEWLKRKAIMFFINFGPLRPFPFGWSKENATRMIEQRVWSFSYIALISKGNGSSGGPYDDRGLYPEGCRDVSQCAGSNLNGERSICAGNPGGGLELSCVHLSDSLRWDTECS